MFAARDGDGALWLFNSNPVWFENDAIFNPSTDDYDINDFAKVHDSNVLPEILPGTFREVELIIKKD